MNAVPMVVTEAWSIPFWGIGNENWGCGGHMTPEQYG